MKVGILGSGDVAQSLAKGFIKYNYEVMVGSRDKNKLDNIKKTFGDKIKTGSFKETATFGEIIVLAVKGSAAEDALTLAGKESLKGKTVIDTTNPIADSKPENGVLKFFTNLDSSLMEELQKEFEDSNFVKAFSCVGNTHMVNPEFSEKPSMFICGNNENSKKEVSEIVEKFGFEVEDMGKAESARAIEPLCILWCIPGFIKNDWNHAFRMLKG